MSNLQGRYVKSTLSKGEKIVEAFPEHWIRKIEYYSYYIVALCFLALWGLVFTSNVSTISSLDISSVPHWVFLGIGGFFFLCGAFQHIEFNFREFVLTNKRFVVKKGIIAVKTDEQILSKTDTAELDQTIMGRILGYATIKLTTTGNSDVLLTYLSKPRRVKAKIEENL